MLTKTLKKVGNSQAIFLDKTLLGLIGAQDDTVFKVTIEGCKVILEPATSKEIKEEAMNVAKRVMKTHSATLKKLAK